MNDVARRLLLLVFIVWTVEQAVSKDDSPLGGNASADPKDVLAFAERIENDQARILTAKGRFVMKEWLGTPPPSDPAGRVPRSAVGGQPSDIQSSPPQQGQSSPIRTTTGTFYYRCPNSVKLDMFSDPKTGFMPQEWLLTPDLTVYTLAAVWGTREGGASVRYAVESRGKMFIPTNPMAPWYCGSEPLSKFIRDNTDKVSNEGEAELDGRKCDIVLFQWQPDRPNGAWTRVFVDRASGLRVMDQRSMAGIVTRTVEMQTVGGFLFTKKTTDTYREPGAQLPYRTLETTFEGVAINQDVPEGVFSVAGLRGPEGAEVVDIRERRIVQWDGSKQSPEQLESLLEEGQTKANPEVRTTVAQGRSSFLICIIAASACAGLLVVLNLAHWAVTRPKMRS